jgi:hypothetical protein
MRDAADQSIRWRTGVDLQSKIHVADGASPGTRSSNSSGLFRRWTPTWMLLCPPGRSGLGPQDRPGRSEASIRICTCSFDLAPRGTFASAPGRTSHRGRGPLTYQPSKRGLRGLALCAMSGTVALNGSMPRGAPSTPAGAMRAADGGEARSDSPERTASGIPSSQRPDRDRSTVSGVLLGRGWRGCGLRHSQTRESPRWPRRRSG